MDNDSFVQSEIYMTTIDSLLEYLPDHQPALKHCSFLFCNTRLGNGNITRLFAFFLFSFSDMPPMPPITPRPRRKQKFNWKADECRGKAYPTSDMVPFQ
jgi:hypothetical protein